MSRKTKTKTQQVVELVHDWVKLDNPEGMKDSVDKWTGRKPFEEKISKRNLLL